MKPSLQLQMSQQLTMTPQLQQAIKLLQLSTLDLQLEIQEALESNPLLDVEEDFSSTPKAAEDEPHSGLEAPPSDSLGDDIDNPDMAAASATNASSETTQTEAQPESSVETDWDENYTSSSSSSSASVGSETPIEARSSEEESLADHLMWQLNLTPISDIDRTIAFAIIECLDTNGYLTAPIEDIVEAANNSAQGLRENDPVESEEVMAVLHLIQQFDPPGVAAQNLADSLTIQLKQKPEDTPWRSEALLITTKYLSLLGSKDFNQLQKHTKLNEEALKSVIALIQSLNPHPGAAITPSNAEYVVPDVIVTKIEGRWLVQLNPETTPKLRINSDYASLIRRADNSDDNTYLKNNLQEARWFIKSIMSRNETLLKVSSRIVEHQQDFFEHGEEAMKPLVLHDIAEAVDMHESTVSRVTTQKFMHTPLGIFELKYFFSSHVGTTSGGECSSTAIRAIIKKLVAAENARKPLSDSKIANLLNEQGIKVARRTIAKYRESLNIPPSNERKQLI